MGIILRFDDNEFEIDSVRYIKAKKILRGCYTNKLNGNIEYIDIPYLLDENTQFPVKYTDFKLFLFHKDNFATNEIFEIKHKKERLGWLFPIEALLSNQHDEAANEHFWPYSLNAYKNLLLATNNIPFEIVTYDNLFKLDEVFGNNTFVLILYKKYLTTYEQQNYRSFQIEDYLPYMYSLGYTILTKENFKSLKNIKDSKPFVPSKLKIIKLESISKELYASQSYIVALIQGLLKLEDHCLVKFHLLYQIIELLITKIFEKEFKELMPTFLNPIDFYDAKEQLGKLTNEKDRINKLFNNYSSSTIMASDLKMCCNEFIQLSTPNKSINNLSHALYKVRSQLFHNLRDLPVDYSPQLNKINLILEKFILNILITYKNP